MRYTTQFLLSALSAAQFPAPSLPEVAFPGYLGLAIVLGRVMGNIGPWRVFCCFMILRGSVLAARLARIERTNFALRPVPETA
jgi:hypothetical protein